MQRLLSNPITHSPSTAKETALALSLAHGAHGNRRHAHGPRGDESGGGHCLHVRRGGDIGRRDRGRGAKAVHALAQGGGGGGLGGGGHEGGGSGCGGGGDGQRHGLGDVGGGGDRVRGGHGVCGGGHIGGADRHGGALALADCLAGAWLEGAGACWIERRGDRSVKPRRLAQSNPGGTATAGSPARAGSKHTH